ncbi:NADPH-dependent FMN reductase [Streptomyces sp. NPDC087294]|uniref:NADPH-dependent FMN reductase n=1 Tax=Streptomyces sp. NPDC087294 TaxID=3365777 RepID=UPI003801C46C
MPISVLRLAILTASTRTGRMGLTISGWLDGVVKEHPEFEPDTVHLADYPLPPAPSLQPGPEVRVLAGRLAERLARADAFVIVTPEYNHSFPAALKIAVDWNYVQWQAKPVAFVSYGGRSGGLRAVEQLRQVFGELHAVTLRDGVSFHAPGDTFDGSGQPTDLDGCGSAAKTMLDQLAWWGRVLANARREQPYGS